MSWHARENACLRATFRLTPAGRDLFVLSTTRFYVHDKTNCCADDSTAWPTTRYSAAWERYSTFTFSSALKISGLHQHGVAAFQRV